VAGDIGPTPDAEWDVPPVLTASGVLVGLVQSPPAERARRPDHRHQIDVEIHGSNPEGRADEALGAVGVLLRDIDALRTSAEALAPEDWKAEVRDSPTYPGLFLEGIEFDDGGLVRVLFDYDGMELLILDLHPDGHRSVVFE
jgi:hypothetical protein